MAGVITIGKPSPKQGENSQGQGGIFKHEAKSLTQDYSEDMINLSRRMRIVEERNTSIQNRVETVEQNMITRYKHLNTEIKTMNFDINELKKEITELKERVLMLIKELQMSATREEVTILKKYIDMWEPVNFVTHNEVEELIEEAMNKREVSGK